MTTKRAFIGGFFLYLGLSTLFVAHQRFGIARTIAAQTTSRESPRIIVDTNALPKDTRGITSFAPVVKKVAPSVVTIYSTKTVRQNLRPPILDDPFFRRFFGFGDEDEEAPPGRRGGRGGRQAPREYKEQGLGSGVIVSADGYILSNNHVVEGADEVKVALSGTEDEMIAKVIGTDPQTDVSVLKVERKDLTPITMTDSDHLQVGDIVLAVGNPFGVGQAVTMGIVSATGRGRLGIVDYEDFIQTDAPINQGNSGGALVDAQGRLVGINTAILSPSGGSIGVGFAVPINMARRVMDTIIREGKVTRGYLGIYPQDISPQLAKEFNLKDRSGAIIGGVLAKSPAAKADLQPGDVILEFNGRKVPDSRQFRLWVSQTPPNTKVNLRILRDGKEKTVSATLAPLTSDQVAGSPATRERPEQPQKSDALDGVEVTDIDGRTRRQLSIPPEIHGALVTNVDPDSTAAAAGLEPGNVILEINRKKIASSQEAIDLSDKLKSDQPILLRVWATARGGGSGTRFMVVEPAKGGKSRK